LNARNVVHKLESEANWFALTKHASYLYIIGCDDDAAKQSTLCCVGDGRHEYCYHCGSPDNDVNEQQPTITVVAFHLRQAWQHWRR